MIAWLTCFWAASPLLAIPAVQFSSPSVTVSQVTAGGQVVLIYAGHETDGPLVRRSVEFEQVPDGDQDGSVSYNSGSPLVTKAVWAAVDLTTGAVTVDAPNGYQPTQLTVDPAALTATPGEIDFEGQTLHLLVVRPGSKGGLEASAYDGAASDAGAADDGRVVLDLADLRTVDTGASLRGVFNVQTGDVLVGVDSEFLTYFVVTVP